MDHLLRGYVGVSSARVALWDRLVKDETGEGVISAAMAARGVIYRRVDPAL